MVPGSTPRGWQLLLLGIPALYRGGRSDLLLVNQLRMAHLCSGCAALSLSRPVDNRICGGAADFKPRGSEALPVRTAAGECRRIPVSGDLHLRRRVHRSVWLWLVSASDLAWILCDGFADRDGSGCD